ncbi:hypothetical protein ACJIZ3_015967 [Penstemon smallii]|uniref:TPX2 C-terminal domain-containing protein n=1 Tax=Penstemon smallii TaxID=265156 RepID=A0ABD3RP11_9LAMI
MGRDVTGIRSDKKPVNIKSNGTFHTTVHVAPKAIPETDETKDYNHNLKANDVKSTTSEPEEKIITAEAHKSNDKRLSTPVKPASGSAVNGTIDANSSEKQSPLIDHANGVEINDSGVKCSPKTNNLHSPVTVKKSQPNTPFISRKYDGKFYDEEDNWSLASSTATTRTTKSRITVPVAPRFTCMDRLERRREFYTKLEEKHKALEKEKLEYEARTKEEEQAAIKQLRKSMTYKAKPVPSFYREGPPPKVELKKLPVTRAKSPNLTRRKSCSDAVKPAAAAPEENGHCKRAPRHSIGTYNQGKSSPLAPKSTKDRMGARKSNETNKVKDRPQQLKKTMENPQVGEQGNADIAVES